MILTPFYVEFLRSHDDFLAQLTIGIRELLLEFA